MVEALNSLTGTQAIAVSLLAPGVVLVSVAFLVAEGARFIRLALTGRL